MTRSHQQLHALNRFKSPVINMKKTIMMFSSLGLLALGGMLLIADSAEPPLDCEGTNAFDAQYLFELSCNHDGKEFTHKGETHIEIANVNDIKMSSDVDEITFKPTNANHHDRSCEDRTDKKQYFQTLFYKLKLDDGAQGIKADLECASFELMDRDKLVTEEQSGSCDPSRPADQSDPPPLICKIKLLPK